MSCTESPSPPSNDSTASQTFPLFSFSRRDTILLKGLVFHGYHGVLEEERRLGQKFVVDIEASADLARAGQTDDLADTVNYAAVYQ